MQVLQDDKKCKFNICIAVIFCHSPIFYEGEAWSWIVGLIGLWHGNSIQTNFGAFSMKPRIKIHSWNSSSNLHKCIQLGRIWNLYLWELICIVIIPLLNYFSTPSPTWPTSKSDATFILWFCLYVAPKQYLGCFLAEDEINSWRFHRNSEWFSDPGQNTGFIVHPWTSFQGKVW